MSWRKTISPAASPVICTAASAAATLAASRSPTARPVSVPRLLLRAEPSLTGGDFQSIGEGVSARALARHALFGVDLLKMNAGAKHRETIGEARVIGVVSGTVKIPHTSESVTLTAGQFALVPAALEELRLEAQTEARVLVAAPG